MLAALSLGPCDMPGECPAVVVSGDLIRPESLPDSQVWVTPCVLLATLLLGWTLGVLMGAGYSCSICRCCCQRKCTAHAGHTAHAGQPQPQIPGGQTRANPRRPDPGPILPPTAPQPPPPIEATQEQNGAYVSVDMEFFKAQEGRRVHTSSDCRYLRGRSFSKVKLCSECFNVLVRVEDA